MDAQANLRLQYSHMAYMNRFSHNAAQVMLDSRVILAVKKYIMKMHLEQKVSLLPVSIYHIKRAV